MVFRDLLLPLSCLLLWFQSVFVPAFAFPWRWTVLALPLVGTRSLAEIALPPAGFCQVTLRCALHLCLAVPVVVAGHLLVVGYHVGLGLRLEFDLAGLPSGRFASQPNVAAGY